MVISFVGANLFHLYCIRLLLRANRIVTNAIVMNANRANAIGVNAIMANVIWANAIRPYGFL